jgi:hypothetical protein
MQYCIAKAAFKKKDFFHHQTGLKSEEETSKVLPLLLFCIVLKLGHFGTYQF